MGKNVRYVVAVCPNDRAEPFNFEIDGRGRGCGGEVLHRA